MYQNQRLRPPVPAPEATPKSLPNSEASLLRVRARFPLASTLGVWFPISPQHPRGLSESPHVSRRVSVVGECGCHPSRAQLTRRSLPPPPDDSVAAPKSPWGINIIKKNKKAAPRAFGIRLEECQPATENQVGPHHTAEQAGGGGGGDRAERDLEAAVRLVLQTQLGKGGEGAAELRQSPEPLPPGQCPSSDQGEAWGLF